ncbi:UPF0182 family protein [Agromyces sp. ISL-38]|uniref:UPF0182 family membrane protein n=1 Tax=Agromyces sp. ISL-38 TaxID=2819107 RepID=UPI001BE95C1E|nr:UPF0182 family protein [Agromyces sp. ISL-38]MBT2499490.1 UPF0182 family protein [Agromyces sp. ISL-38]MBT2516378.1 UPF0182 family protein [Streptomyces sp. ISL-90]
MPRRRAPIAITIGVVAALVIAFFVFAGLYADVLWFDQLGFLPVLTTEWISRIVLFVVGFVAMALPVWASIQIAYRTRPVYAKLNSQLDRYQEVFEPLRRLAMFGIPVVLGVFAGVSVSSRWELTLTFLNRTPFGTTDPQFGFDVGFFVFELPYYRSIVGFASAVVLLSVLLVIATNYLYGAIRVSGREVVISKSARVQIAITAGIYLLLQAVSIWFDQYATVTETGELITGAAYTDVNATIPGHGILAAIAAVVAVLFFITAAIGRWRLPLIGTALLIVSSILIGSLYPWVVQRFQVDPSARTLEAPYIQRSIDLTRDAYDVADIEQIPYEATTDATPGALRADAETTANIRLMDPLQISDAFAQLEQFRQYYQFPDALDVDRYNIDGATQDTVVAIRDLNLAGLGDAQTWFNTHLVYTHGYGLVAAAGNQRSVDGQPVFLQSSIPSTGDLGEFEPRVYFGEESPEYSIVGAPDGNDPVELDYPAGGDGGQTQTTFKGEGGPKLDNVFTKLVYALKFQSEQIFLSDVVTNESQILYDRDPIQRVQKVAPYLTLDSDAYPSVVDGRVVWIVDGYTLTDQYPYSNKQSMSDAIADSEGLAPTLAFDEVNYIRNSVKATVDAYDGKVTLYAWDEEDPILQTWQKIFPTTLQPMSEMSGELMSHVRYPSDLFKVQRAVLGRYHVTDASSFYSREDAWTTPKDPTAGAGSTLLQPPYYLTMQMPGQDDPSYSLYSSFIPEARGEQSRNVLRGYLAVDADAGNVDGERSDGYGKLRLLTLPEDDNVPGPGQVQNKFNGDPSISAQLNILKQGQSEVINGNLLTVPVGGGLLYVQPVYVKSTGETSYPLLQKVLVAFGDHIAFEDTLDLALDVLFGGESGAEAGDNEVEPGTEPTTPPEEGAPTTPETPTDEVQALLNEASQALKEKEAALAKGDWAAYGVADERLAEIITNLIELTSATSTTTE